MQTDSTFGVSKVLPSLSSAAKVARTVTVGNGDLFTVTLSNHCVLKIPGLLGQR